MSYEDNIINMSTLYYSVYYVSHELGKFITSLYLCNNTKNCIRNAQFENRFYSLDTYVGSMNITFLYIVPM